jgi:signal transduction histidine kinase
MMYWGIACGFLFAGFAFFLIKWLLFKRDTRQLGDSLRLILETDTNARLKTISFEKEIVALADRINAALEKSRRSHLASRRLETDLKRAITNISHDLRTPLTSAKGYLQMIKSGGLDNETANRYLATIGGRLDALTILMDNLFAFTQAVEGNITLTRVNAGNILRDALSDNYAELENRGFAVESKIPDSPHYITADEEALKRVVQNLISNAYTHGKEYLRVTVTDGIIEIANKASDIDTIDTLRIFDRFYTADASRTHKRTGLGLAIARELTEKMGGSLTAEKNGDMLTLWVELFR